MLVPAERVNAWQMLRTFTNAALEHSRSSRRQVAKLAAAVFSAFLSVTTTASGTTTATAADDVFLFATPPRTPLGPEKIDPQIRCSYAPVKKPIVARSLRKGTTMLTEPKSQDRTCQAPSL